LVFELTPKSKVVPHNSSYHCATLGKFWSKEGWIVYLKNLRQFE
jgi:hypothetical protein